MTVRQLRTFCAFLSKSALSLFGHRFPFPR
jgi:hypothetical protein